MQLHGQRQHGGCALRLGRARGGGTGDLLQAAGLGARLHLGELLAQLGLAGLGFLKLAGDLAQLVHLLGGGTDLLLGGGQLTGEILGAGAELVALTLHGGQLRGDVLVPGGLGGLGGQLIDLSAQTIDLALQLLVLSGQRTVALLGLGQLGGVHLGGLIAGGGNLQTLVLGLQRLHLRGQLRDLGVQAGDIRSKRLGGLAALHGLTAQCLDSLGHLIQEVVDLVDIIAFLQSNGPEGMLPNILRRQQSHKIAPRFRHSAPLCTYSMFDASTPPVQHAIQGGAKGEPEARSG